MTKREKNERKETTINNGLLKSPIVKYFILGQLNLMTVKILS